jgi:signal transduction histidine kinase
MATTTELSISVNTDVFHTLLSPDKLRNLVEPLEVVLDLQGTIVVLDSWGQPQYGRLTCDRLAVSEPIVVDQRQIGLVGLCAAESNARAVQAVTYLAYVLATVATETYRQQKMADEVLERYDELNLIYDLANLISRHTLSLDEILRSVLEQIHQILQVEAAVVYLYDAQHSELLPISHLGRRSDEQFWMGRIRELALSTLYAYDTAQLFDGGRVICAPLRYDVERLGTLVVIRDGARVFNANDVNLLATLAQNTALFIQAARLFDSLAQRNRELELTLQELQSTREELNRAERLSLIGQIVGGLVHDMRGPLNIVMGYAGMLQEGGLTEDEVSEYATQIILFVDAFSSMAQEILDYARDDELVDLQPVVLADYMQAVGRQLMPPGLRRSVRIDVEYPPASPARIRIDKTRFTRVFQNLVNNSIDAIEDKGGTCVIVRAEPTPDGYVRFSVNDDGPGVPDDMVETIFEPLVTTKSQGTGLGLAIVRRMVNKHGGDIHYERAPEGGASFVFSIPQA